MKFISGCLFVIGGFFALVGLMMLKTSFSSGLLGILLGFLPILLGKYLLLKKKAPASSTKANKSRPESSPSKIKMEKIPSETSPKNPSPTNIKLLFPENMESHVLAYFYKDENIAMPDMNQLSQHKIGQPLTLLFEPNNKYDANAIRIMIDNMPVGYVYRGKIQDMIHDFIRKGDPVIAKLSFIDNENGRATMAVAFYKNHHTAYKTLDSITTKLTKTSKKIGSFESRQDNYFQIVSGMKLELEYDDDSETYIVSDHAGNELGEINQSISAKIYSMEDTHEPICVIDDVFENEEGKYGANVVIYFK